MTREQINQLDAIPDGEPAEARIMDRAGELAASIGLAVFLQRRDRGAAFSWVVATRHAHIVIRERDEVEISRCVDNMLVIRVSR
jgi:hypothetical protein